MTGLNLFFDTLPRVTVAWTGRPQPAFRTCGEIGFAAAVLATAAATLLGGLSLPVAAAATVTAVATFYGWALLRKAITGQERLVLLEHVWIALAAVALCLHAAGAPALPYLGAMTPGLSLFLAGGRAGCLLVGCCHGHPSAIGLRYGPAHVREGFAAHLLGIRLFPVQLVEFAGLLAIATVAFALAAASRQHLAFVWFLFAYGVLRFATEGVRGDDRPQWLGLSLPRWMCLVQAVIALTLSATPLSRLGLGVGIALAVCAWRFSHNRNGVLLAPGHIAEIRRLTGNPSAKPVARFTSRRVSVAASTIDGTRALHLSLRLPSAEESLPLVCRLAAEAFPDLDPDQAAYGENGTLHFVIRPDLASSRPPHPRATFEALYRNLLTGQSAFNPPVRRPIHSAPWYWRRTS